MPSVAKGWLKVGGAATKIESPPSPADLAVAQELRGELRDELRQFTVDVLRPELTTVSQRMQDVVRQEVRNALDKVALEARVLEGGAGGNAHAASSGSLPCLARTLTGRANGSTMLRKSSSPSWCSADMRFALQEGLPEQPEQHHSLDDHDNVDLEGCRPALPVVAVRRAGSKPADTPLAVCEEPVSRKSHRQLPPERHGTSEERVQLLEDSDKDSDDSLAGQGAMHFTKVRNSRSTRRETVLPGSPKGSVSPARLTMKFGGANASQDEIDVGSEGEDDESPWNSYFSTDAVLRIVKHPYFNFFFGGLIFANVGIMGVELELQIAGMSATQFVIVDRVFCFFFVLELLLRVGAFGTEFFVGDKWMWNIFDLLLVVFQILDNAIPRTEDGSSKGFHGVNVSFLRFLSVVKNIRVLRVLRVCRFVTELRILLIIIGGSFRSTFWTILSLLMLTYAFSLCIMMVIKEQVSQKPEVLSEHPGLVHYFGSVSRTMWSLYLSISSGVSWEIPANILADHVSPIVLPFFGLYVAFMVFVFLNIITGIFLNTAMSTSEDINHRNIVQQMKRIFKAMDSDKSGAVNFEEFQEVLNDREMGIYLRSIGWRPEQAEELFRVLDSDESGEISIDEFISGCIRLKGDTKAVDFAAFVVEFYAFQVKVLEHVEAMEPLRRMMEDSLGERGVSTRGAI